MEKLLTKGGNILLFCDHRLIEWFGLKGTIKIIFSFFLSFLFLFFLSCSCRVGFSGEECTNSKYKNF